MQPSHIRIFGYARVSSQEQNLDRQIESLKQYVEEENILTDKGSGKNLDRPTYQALKGALGLREGDVLYITSLDRLSRNKEDIKKELQCEYYGAAEPPVRCGVSHLSGPTEPPVYSYSA